MSLRALRELHRVMAAVAPGGAPRLVTGAPLEVNPRTDEPPRTRMCRVVEEDGLRAREIRGEPVVSFAAFLDGTQESHAVWDPAGIPIVFARVGAVIRRRVARRMTTWKPGPLVAHRLYAPRRWLSDEAVRALEALGLALVDSLEGESTEGPLHPHELLRRAVHRVQSDREALERELAERWCASEHAPLFIDGGLPSGPLASSSPWCVGVVKSHHTLYVDARGLSAVLTLATGHRSSVFIVERSWGPGALSWYLRLRPPATHDPLTGLVRVEIPLTDDARHGSGLTERADHVSRWILAERQPVALPDGRWDRMVYGIRDCEEYLTAVM
ncbi:MAG TPA: hypothetical protein VF178_07135 [Gemmatimonadaceae bacterium]